MADLTNLPWNQWAANAKPQDQVCRNFLLRDLARSELAERRLIGNDFEDTAHLRSAVHLCRRAMQPLHDAFGPFAAQSVYRSQALERALKGMPADWRSTSQHALGGACDLAIPGMPTLDLALWLSRNLEFDQIICEYYDPAKGARSGWVHLSLRAPGAGVNRAEVLSYVYDARNARFAYVRGLLPGLA